LRKTLFLALASLDLAAIPTYKISSKIKIAGDVRWDDLYVDSANHRAYISHNSQVEVIDTVDDKLVGTISDTPVVNGIAVANDLGRGFITTGNPGNKVIIFDLTTLRATGSAGAGQNPDAVSYDPLTKRIVTFNDRSKTPQSLTRGLAKSSRFLFPLGVSRPFRSPRSTGRFRRLTWANRSGSTLMAPYQAKIRSLPGLSSTSTPTVTATCTPSTVVRTVPSLPPQQGPKTDDGSIF